MGKTFQGCFGNAEKTIDVNDLVSFGCNIDIVSEEPSSYYANVYDYDDPVVIEKSTFEALQKLYPNKEDKEE